MKNMRFIALLSVMSAVLVLVLGSHDASTEVESGWKGDLFGAAAVWGYYYSDPYINSSHAAWLENHGAGGVAYSWEFSSGLPDENVSAVHWNTGFLRANKAIFPSSQLWINLDWEGVPRGDTYDWHLYTRMDVGAKSWRVDISTTVHHPLN